jgi:hypothetical protein
MKSLDSFERQQFENDYIEDVQGNLETVKMIVDDNRSPLLSLLIDTEKYVNEPLPLELHEQYPDDLAYETPVDIARTRHDSKRLASADQKVTELYNSLVAMKLKIFYEKCELESAGLDKQD